MFFYSSSSISPKQVSHQPRVPTQFIMSLYTYQLSDKTFIVVHKN